MGIYVGIDERTDKLVAGDMILEISYYSGQKEESLYIFDYELLKLVPVTACIKVNIPI